MCRICGRLLDSSGHNEVICGLCRNGQRSFDMCRSLLMYDDISRRVIMKIKRYADRGVARHCCKLIAARCETVFDGGDLITPVPSHWTRVLRRSCNPPSIIAAELSKILKIQLVNLLKRDRRTDYQKNKTLNERRKNVKDSFLCRHNLDEKTIVLVDDVMTTGSTLDECSMVLKLAGASKVVCITIASTGEGKRFQGGGRKDDCSRGG
jgi:ComF family protein